MSWWSEDPEANDFDVYLSVGLPGPIQIDRDRADLRQGPRPPRSQVAHWSSAVLSVARSVLSRGGRIIAGFDPDVTPLLWAVGAEYASARPAEVADEREVAPMALLISDATRLALREQGPSGPEREHWADDEMGFLGFYESTFATSFHRSESREDDRGRTPLQQIQGSPNQIALLVWPDENCEGDRAPLAAWDQVALIPDPGRPQLAEEWREMARISADQLVRRRSAELDHERTALAFPYGFAVHRLIDEWTGSPTR